MRPKKTYLNRKQPQHLAYWEGEHAKADDATLPQELAAIVQDARASYSIKKTPAQDIKATLRGLSLMVNDAKIKQAAHVMDDFTKIRLCSAAGQMWRDEHPETQPIMPIDLLNMESWKIPDDLYSMTLWQYPDDLLDMKTWNAEYIQKVARYALKTMTSKNGRQSMIHRDVQFAARLAAYWQKTEKKKATVTVTSTFVDFSVDKFHRAGRFVDASALDDILRQGCDLVDNAT